MKRCFFFIVASFSLVSNCDAAIDLLTEGIAQGITVDLREPSYSEGVLTTTRGGVISAPNLRIQALSIVYTRKTVDDKAVLTIEAEGELMLQFGEYTIVGQRLDYDFIAKHGIVYHARTGTEPWYFGGESIELLPDGSYLIHNGFFTASENYCSEWAIAADTIQVSAEHRLHASNVRFRLLDIPVFWLPSLKLDLNSIYDSPLKYRANWGGKQGPRVGITYEFFSWERFKAYLRLDYRLKRGLGGGLETYYRSADHKSEFHTINYLANDSSISDPKERTRYRFEGIYHNQILGDSITIDLSYDKISDIDMPSDYYDKGIDLETAERTQLLIRRQEDYWIGNFYTRLRVNNFQTVKQELPTLFTTFHPFEIGPTGIIMENVVSGSYLDFKYANSSTNVTDYTSTRFEYRPRFYRTFTFGSVNATPQAGAVGIFYGNSPESEAKWLAVGTFGLEMNTSLYRQFRCYKHVIEPYVDYAYYTFPTISPEDHYIFDIGDGWYRLNTLRYGMRHAFYKKTDSLCCSRPLSLDIYSYAFFDTPTIPQAVPKLYMRLVSYTLPTLKHTYDAAWNFAHRQIDHFNFRSDWTATDDLAIAAEYRYRSRFAWRKVDYTNFILDSFRSEKELLHSSLSDRRHTLLFDLFYRFRPNWACAIKGRYGWNRKNEPSFTEYEVDLLTTIRTAWHVRLSYQHQEEDDRFAIYVNVGLRRPDLNSCPIPFFD